MGQTIVLVSSKGGSGKSTVAVGLSAALSVSGKRILLIDIDEGARCLDTMLSINADTVFDIADVLLGNVDYKDASLSVSALPNVAVIPSPYENKPLDFKKLAEFTQSVSDEFDYIILDTKGQLPADRLSQLKSAAKFVAVVTDNSVALKNTGVLCRGLAEKGIECRLIINRYKPRGQNKKINNIDEMINTCQASLLGIVPEDKIMSVYAGRPIVFGSAAKAIHRIAARLEGQAVPLPKIKDIK